MDLIWRDLPNQPYHDDRPYKQGWSFYYYCKKNGDDVSVKIRPNGNIDVIIKTRALF